MGGILREGRRILQLVRPTVNRYMKAHAAERLKQPMVEFGDRLWTQRKGLLDSITRADEEPVPHEVEGNLEGAIVEWNGQGREAVCSDVKRDVPRVIYPWHAREPDLAHNLCPPVQRRVRIRPCFERETWPCIIQHLNLLVRLTEPGKRRSWARIESSGGPRSNAPSRTRSSPGSPDPHPNPDRTSIGSRGIQPAHRVRRRAFRGNRDRLQRGSCRREGRRRKRWPQRTASPPRTRRAPPGACPPSTPATRRRPSRDGDRPRPALALSRRYRRCRRRAHPRPGASRRHPPDAPGTCSSAATAGP